MSNTMESEVGARMLPAVCPAGASPGEREVFRMLRRDPDAAGWTVLHSLDLADHIRRSQGEADFVVLIPGEGIVVIEVKSHTSVRVTERGWWLGNSSCPDTRGPFRQASEALHSIRKYVEPSGLSESVPMVSMVIFSSLSFRINSPEWNSWQALDKQALYARSISANLIRVIRKAREFYAKKNMAWMRDRIEVHAGRLDQIAQLLRPRFEILASPSTRRLNLEENLIRCTEQQFKILDATASNNRLLVTGLAGTGKTTLATEVVRREKVTMPESVVGFFCFNKLLGYVLTKECSPLGQSTRLGSFHSWMVEFSGIIPDAGRTGDPNFWNRELPEECISKLTAPGMPSGFLDLLVLDEAQDLFVDTYLDIFDLLLKGGLKAGRWRFFGDFDRQDIFAQGTVSRKEFYEKRVDERCAVQTLSENCRNTQEISAALTLHARVSPGYSRVLREDTRHDPDILFYDDRVGQLKSVDTLMDAYLAEGFKLSEIVLLSPHKETCLAKELANSSSWKGRLKEYTDDPKHSSYCTIHAFKGLEAAVVIITDIESLAAPKDFDLLYIGMSRALHRLALLCHDKVGDQIKKSCIQ